MFNSSTKPALDFYKRFGKVHTVSSEGSIEEVHLQVLEHLKKHLIFLFGPPCIEKTHLAELLANTTGFRHLELKNFWGFKGWNEEKKVNRLMEFLSEASEGSFIIDGFFESRKQAKVFVESFQKPNLVFYFEATKDYVDERLRLGDKDKVSENEKAYSGYLKNRKELVELFKKDSSFIKLVVDNDKPAFSYYDRIINDYLAPEVYMGIYEENEALFRDYIVRLEEERGFVHLPLNLLLKQEAERRTELGLEILNYNIIEVPLECKIKLIRKILFSQPKSLKFIITDYPNSFDDYQTFENDCREISGVITFAGEAQTVPFICSNGPFFTPQTYYHTLGRHMVIDRPNLALFDHYTSKKNSYYLVLSSPFFERTTITKHIVEKFGFQLIEWEETLTKLKEKLGGDDGPVEEVPFSGVLKHFQEVFLTMKGKAQTLILDGFPFPLDNLQAFIKALGAPKAIVNLELNKEGLLKAYKLNKGMEIETEVPEEELEEMYKAKERIDVFSDEMQKIAEEGFGIDFFRINANISLSSIKNSVESLFFKRVYLICHSLPIYDEGQFDEKFLQTFANIACKSQISFVDVRALIRKEYREEGPLFERLNSQFSMRWTEKRYDFASNYSLPLIMELIKKHLAGLNVQSREILLYNYPMGDYTHDKNPEENMYPRALDELAVLEEGLGQIRMIFSINEGLLRLKLY